MTQELHCAKIIITNYGEPIFNSAVLIEDSKIVQVGKKEDFGSTYELIDHKDALICPGFINLHTHLLYSNLNLTENTNGLFPWLEQLVKTTSKWSEDDFINSIKSGMGKVLSTGTTYVVENTPSHLSAEVLSKSPLKALIGLEVFGSDEEKADEIFNKIQSTIRNQDRINPAPIKLDFTLSPHAPYDVSAPLWKYLIDWSQKNKKPLLTHLEESPEEKIWWQKKEGKAINFWNRINKLEAKIKYWKKYNSGIDFLNRNHILDSNIISTHLCEATKEDLLILKEKNISLVHCPRSNYYLGNKTANIKLWDELGILWGLGTDSIASNKNLDLLDELRFTINQQKDLYNYSISAKDTFHKVTKDAARILKKESEIGSLKKNRFGDFLVYDIKNKPASTYNDPYNLLVFNIDNSQDLKEVWINGEKVWIAKPVLTKI